MKIFSAFFAWLPETYRIFFDAVVFWIGQSIVEIEGVGADLFQKKAVGKFFKFLVFTDKDKFFYEKDRDKGQDSQCEEETQAKLPAFKKLFQKIVLSYI